MREASDRRRSVKRHKPAKLMQDSVVDLRLYSYDEPSPVLSDREPDRWHTDFCRAHAVRTQWMLNTSLTISMRTNLSGRVP
jgi:hypothetical protein